MLLFNGTLFIGRRVFESRSRDGSQAVSTSSVQLNPASKIKKALPPVLMIVGLVILVIGGILPTRLPRDERNMGSEATCWIVSAGFVYGATYIERKQRR